MKSTASVPCAIPVLLAALLTALAAATTVPAQTGRPHNSLSEAEIEAGWKLLFDGETLDGWRGYQQPALPQGWAAENGVLAFTPGKGDLISVQTFTNFELELEWMISEGGNSGIFYLAAPGSEAIYMSAPEMQILDDAGHPNGQDPLTSAGANYALHPAPRGVANPAGEWNRVRIRVEGGAVEHWLNGRRIVGYEIGSPEWSRLVARSKFAQWPEYGQARTGHIGLQDHGDPVWFRNIRIRVLD